MAPNLPAIRHAEIHPMIGVGTLKDKEMADVAQCTERSITVNPPMLDALCEHLIEKPDEDQDGMIEFLWDEYQVLCSPWMVSRALSSVGWTKKTVPAHCERTECRST